LSKGAASSFTYVGQAFDDVYLQIMKAGYAPYTYYTYKQVYDAKGKPIEGLYADLNGDGQINSNDLYCGKSPTPDYLMALSSQLRYKNWTLGFAFRASIGNYVYNGTAMNNGALGTVSYNSFQLNNLSTSYLDTGFESRQYLSDYYIEDASFVKMDNVSIGYNFGEVFSGCTLRLSGMVHNVFTITKYSGVDPEISGGIESSFYPRARAYSVSIGLDF
jgi:iron complex outermembrane receptor protein